MTLRLGRNRFEGTLPVGALLAAAGTLMEVDLSYNAWEGTCSGTLSREKQD